MGVSVAVAVLLAGTAVGATIPPQDVQQQNQAFQRYWGTDFVWHFDQLPEKGSVPEHQAPYSGYIYPDKAGGTLAVMRKYDAAFHRGQNLATKFEDWDTKAYKSMVDRRGPLGFMLGKKLDVPSWSGHCNGWAAAAIRHAEPKKSVRVNGVVFTPSDIKGLLAELYIYNDIQNLSGSGGTVNAGLFHVVMANWLGRGSHGLGMESEPGEAKWNYPVYAYNSGSARRAGRQVEVKLNLAYLKDSQGEYDQSPRLHRVKYFHYMLQLDGEGRIVGGRYFPDSAVLDMLWLPLQPKPRGPGNELGNPHLSPQNILAIWRASVPEEERKQWIVIDPTPEDREIELADTEGLIPLGYVRRMQLPPVPVEATITDSGTVWGSSDAPRMAVKQPPSTSTSSPAEPDAETPIVVEDRPSAAADQPGASALPLTQAPGASALPLTGASALPLTDPSALPSTDVLESSAAEDAQAQWEGLLDALSEGEEYAD